jgi:hypothetical protein
MIFVENSYDFQSFPLVEPRHRTTALSELILLCPDFGQPGSWAPKDSKPSLLRMQLPSLRLTGPGPRLLVPCVLTRIQVTLYADRIARVSEKAAPTFAGIPGYALAHELTHVLIRSTGH